MRNPGIEWLRQHILPLNRAFASQWDRVGLVFGMDGPASSSRSTKPMTWCTSAEEPTGAKKILITRGMWNGAATGSGAYQLIVPGTKEVGGYHVQRIS